MEIALILFSFLNGGLIGFVAYGFFKLGIKTGYKPENVAESSIIPRPVKKRKPTESELKTQELLKEINDYTGTTK